MSDPVGRQYFGRSPRGDVHGPYDAQSLLQNIKAGRIASPWMVREGRTGPWMEVPDAIRLLRLPEPKFEAGESTAAQTEAVPAHDAGATLRAAKGSSASNWFTRWAKRQTVWTLRTYATIATFSTFGLAILLGPILGFSMDAVLPIALLGLSLLMLRELLNLACMADPDSDWSHRVREYNKPWRPRKAPAGESPAQAQGDANQVGSPSKSQSVATADTNAAPGSYYEGGDAVWDITRGALALAIGAVGWLFMGKNFATGARIGTLSILILFMLPAAGSYYTGRGAFFFVREWWDRSRGNRPS